MVVFSTLPSLQDPGVEMDVFHYMPRECIPRASYESEASARLTRATGYEIVSNHRLPFFWLIATMDFAIPCLSHHATSFCL